MKKRNDKKAIKHRLRAHCGSGEVISVYLDPEDPELYQSGFLLAVEGKHFLLGEVAENGMYMGYSAYRTKELFKLEYSGKSEEKEQILYKLREQSHPSVEVTGRSLIVDLLEHARQQRLVVTLVQYDGGESYLRGFVKSVRNVMVELHLLDDFGEKDGISLCKLGSITRVHCDGESEQALRELYEYRHKEEKARPAQDA